MLLLLVGHTRNKLDRLRARIAVALAGRDYFTAVGMLRQLQSRLFHCTVNSNHLSHVWAWKELMGHPCTRGMRNLDPVHAFRFERSGGIYVQWKQWCTDEAWGERILLVPPERTVALVSFLFACIDMWESLNTLTNAHTNWRPPAGPFRAV